jgi:hypothetical protein
MISKFYFFDQHDYLIEQQILLEKSAKLIEMSSKFFKKIQSIVK